MHWLRKLAGRAIAICAIVIPFVPDVSFAQDDIPKADVELPNFVIVGEEKADGNAVSLPNFVIVDPEPPQESAPPLPNFVFADQAPARDISVDVADLVIIGRPPAPEITVEVPDLVVIGRPPPPGISIDVPDLVIVGRPPNPEISVDVPELLIVGRPPAPDVTVDVPELVIVGRMPPNDVSIAVADLIIIGRDQEDEDDDPKREVVVSDPVEDPPSTPETPAPAPEPEPDIVATGPFCHGSYTSHFGRGVGTARGTSMPVGQTLEAPASITLRACGASMTLTAQGQSFDLEQDRDDPRRFQGSINGGDGVNRTLILYCGDDLNLRGALTASDANLTVQRPVWLIVAQHNASAPPCD